MPRTFVDGPKANKLGGPILWIFDGPYAFLDNFYESPIDVPGLGNCQTVEHAFQAAKATRREDALRIAGAKSPGEAKYCGRDPDLVIFPDWESRRFGVMRTALEIKFAAYPRLLVKLFATGDRLIEEGNVWGDDEWGCVNRVGQNWLGRMLMDIRDNGFRVIR